MGMPRGCLVSADSAAPLDRQRREEQGWRMDVRQSVCDHSTDTVYARVSPRGIVLRCVGNGSVNPQVPGSSQVGEPNHSSTYWHFLCKVSVSVCGLDHSWTTRLTAQAPNRIELLDSPKMKQIGRVRNADALGTPRLRACSDRSSSSKGFMMASIDTRVSLTGKRTYRARTRLKGFPQQVATFERLTDARKWGGGDRSRAARVASLHDQRVEAPYAR